jgi:hypothetical protein
MRVEAMRMLIVGIVLIVGLGSKAAVQPRANDSKEIQCSNVFAESLENRKLELERDKFTEEVKTNREKSQIEWEKLQVEKLNANRSLISSSLPLLAAFATLAFSIWSFRKQAQQQTAMQAETARLQFEVKAAEIAFSGKTPEAVANRAKALKAMFDGRLPQNFASSFDPGQHGGGKEDPEAKKFFVELLLKYPDRKSEIFGLWHELFGDEWLQRARRFI